MILILKGKENENGKGRDRNEGRLFEGCACFVEAVEFDGGLDRVRLAHLSVESA